MIDQSNILDGEECSHPEYRQGWRVCGLVAVLVAVVLLTAALTASMFLLATKAEAGMGIGRLPGLEGLDLLREVQRQLQVEVVELEQSLAAANRTLIMVVGVDNQLFAEVRKQWDGCRSQLNTMQGSVVELGRQLSQMQQQSEQQDAVVKQLQEDNRALQEEMAQQREQLEEVQRHGNSFQEQIQQQLQQLTAWIWDLKSHSSGASAAMPSCPAMALSLLMTLLTAKWLH
ncbi:uncharacterized protein [Excalfactoria chinensis]|uniref:uncharacterized protein n=1 Tax=Excalfactoria chinensis TaxID=46218 RepID=UPI003B3BD8F2